MPKDLVMRRAWIIGATSSLAEEIAHQLAQDTKRGTWEFVLTGRNEEQLDAIASDLRIRYGVTVSTLPADLASPKRDAKALTEQAGACDAVFWLAGDMGSDDQNDPANIRRIIEVNFTSGAEILTCVAAQMQERASGTIVVVSSVAGDRGRQSNYPYGSAKAGLTAFAAGLRNRLCHRVKKGRVHVLTVKPGFVDTPMTWGMQSPLIAPREVVAAQIIRAMRKRKNTIYTPPIWRIIMGIIIHIPEFLFKRLGL